MTNKMPENHPNSIGERLATRFMVEKYSGGQRSFFDRETGKQGLLPMHLIGVAMGLKALQRESRAGLRVRLAHA